LLAAPAASPSLLPGRGNGSSQPRRLLSVRSLVNQGISRYPLDVSYHERHFLAISVAYGEHLPCGRWFWTRDSAAIRLDIGTELPVARENSGL
jgi:hypothetical protein